MARRRSRAKKSSSTTDDDLGGVVHARRGGSDSGNPRALQTLPSALSTQRLARSQSKISELIDHAHQHVELAMRLCVGEDNAGVGGDAGNGWPSGLDADRKHAVMAKGSKTTTVNKLLHVLLRKKHTVTRLAYFSHKSQDDDARYNRLQRGYTALHQHLADTEASRKRLEVVLTSFRTRALAMQSVLPPEPRESHVMTTSLYACFAQSAELIDEMMHTLTEDVAVQTQTKINQIAAFKVTLERRDRLKLDMDAAKQQLDQLQRLPLKQRSAIPGAYDLELEQRKHERNALRRRVAALTVATEHIFQFYAHLDHSIVDPEMSLTHRQLTRFFEKHARVFEKNVK